MNLKRIVGRTVLPLIASIGLVVVVGRALALEPPQMEGSDWKEAESGILQLDQPSLNVNVIAPSAAIGDLGASLGNVWDMDSVDDVVWTTPPGVRLKELDNGTVVRGKIPQVEYAVFPIAFYGSDEPLPGTEFHHLLYRLKIPEQGLCQNGGLVTYALEWEPHWPHHTSYFFPHSKPMSCPYGTYCIYYMDLADNKTNDRVPLWRDSSSDKVPSPWLTDEIHTFGLVPHEWWINCDRAGETSGSDASIAPEYFDLDFVYLTGDIMAREVDDYKYKAKWVVSQSGPRPEKVTVVSTVRYQEVHELQLPEDAPECNANNFDNSKVWKDFDPVAQTITRLAPTPEFATDTVSSVFLPILFADAGSSQALPNASLTLSFADDERFTDGKSYYLCIRADSRTEQTYSVSSAPVLRAPLRPYFMPYTPH